MRQSGSRPPSRPRVRAAAGHAQTEGRWGYAPAARVLAVADELRRRAIPADGLWLDIQHMRGFRSFTFDPEAFPDPGKLVADLLGRGFKTTIIVDPGLKVDPGWDVYDAGLRAGHYLEGRDGRPCVGQVWPGAAVFPDFGSAAAARYWRELLRRPVALGVRGLWLAMR